MAITPVLYVLQLIDKSSGNVKPGVNIKITLDGTNFLPSAAGISTDANGIAKISVATIGTYDIYVEGALSTDYQAQTIIPLDANKIPLASTDNTFTTAFTAVSAIFSGDMECNAGGFRASGAGSFILAGTPAVGNNGWLVFSNGVSESYKSGTGNTSHRKFINDNGVVGEIKTNGTGTAYITTSDPRKKTKFTKPSADEAWDKFDAIEDASGVFYFKEDLEKLIWGFDAHKLIDNLGDMGFEGVGSRNKKIGSVITPAVLDKEGRVIERDIVVTPAGVDLSKAIAYLIPVISDLRKRIEILEAK